MTHPDVELVNSLPRSTERQTQPRNEQLRELLRLVVAAVDDHQLTRHVAQHHARMGVR